MNRKMVVDDNIIVEFKERTQQDLEQSIKEGGCGCKSGYCSFDAAARLVKDFNIPIERVVELMVFSKLKAFEASRLLERGLFMNKDAKLVNCLNEAREKISTVFEAVNVPGRVSKKWLKKALQEIIEGSEETEEVEEDNVESNVIEGLRKKHLEGIPCECRDPNCTINLALEILKIAGDGWEEVLVPLAKMVDHYQGLGEYFIEIIKDRTVKIDALGEAIEKLLKELEKVSSPKSTPPDDL